jgi:hypothetical protein
MSSTKPVSSLESPVGGKVTASPFRFSRWVKSQVSGLDTLHRVFLVLPPLTVQCPLCAVDMHHWSLKSQLQPLLELKAKIEGMAHARVAFEGLLKDPAVAVPGGQFYGRPVDFAMDR